MGPFIYHSFPKMCRIGLFVVILECAVVRAKTQRCSPCKVNHAASLLQTRVEVAPNLSSSLVFDEVPTLPPTPPTLEPAPPTPSPTTQVPTSTPTVIPTQIPTQIAECDTVTQDHMCVKSCPGECGVGFDPVEQKKLCLCSCSQIPACEESQGKGMPHRMYTERALVADEGNGIGAPGLDYNLLSCQKLCDKTPMCMSFSYSSTEKRCYPKDKTVQADDASKINGDFKTYYIQA